MSEEIKATVQTHTQSLRHSKEELNRRNQAIQKLTVEVDGAKSQPWELEGAKDWPAVQKGASSSAEAKVAQLKAALQKAKQDVVRQLQEYQELMIIRLGLDFEIAIYRKLLEDQESRFGLGLGAGSSTQSTAPTCGLGLASGPAPLLLPLGAGSGALETSAPGGGCALCGSPGCVGDISCMGSRGC